MKNSTKLPTPEEMRRLMTSPVPAFPSEGSTVRKLTRPLTAEERLGAAAAKSNQPDFVALPTLIERPFLVDGSDPEKNQDISVDESIELIHIDLIEDPFVPQRWHYEVADIAAMANLLLQEGEGDALKGQLQPVRLLLKKNGHYEMIEGKTRLLAFRNHHLGKYIKAIVSKDLDRRKAYRMGYVSNEGRNPLTDYDKGMSFKALIDNGVYANQLELAEDLGIKRQVIGALLSFGKLPESTQAIIERDKTRFGYNTAQHLASLCEKAPESHLNTIAEKVLSGWTVSQLSSHVSRYASDKPRRIKSQKRVSVLGNLGQLECSNKKIALDLDVSTMSEDDRHSIWFELDKVIRERLPLHTVADAASLTDKSESS